MLTVNALVLVAPFIKKDVLERILTNLPEDVFVKCVTRWRVGEIASGVSDIEIWDLFKSNTELYLSFDLHAKYYRFDEVAIIGSANLTNAALGWSYKPNLELLIELSPIPQPILDFEDHVVGESMLVTDEIYSSVKEIVENLEDKDQYKVKKETDIAFLLQELEISESHEKMWIPKLRHPEQLFDAYQGDWDSFSSFAKEAVLKDLVHFPMEEGQNRNNFELSVGLLLLQKPIVIEIDNFLVTSQRFGAVRQHLRGLPCSENKGFDATIAWQTLMRWMLYFLPNRYGRKVPHYSEVIYRKGIEDDIS